MNVYSFMERCSRSGIAVELRGDARSTVVVVDGKTVGEVRGDIVALY